MWLKFFWSILINKPHFYRLDAFEMAPGIKRLSDYGDAYAVFYETPETT